MALVAEPIGEAAVSEFLGEAGWVEIHGVVGHLEVFSGPPGTLGRRDDLNGMRGWAELDTARGRYLVEMLDGLHTWVPSTNLRAIEQVPPEEGGFDVACGDIADPSSWFGVQALSHVLRAKGYCVLRVPQVEKAVLRAAVEREDFCLPETELEAAFLGTSANSKVAWVVGNASHPATKACAWEGLVGNGFAHHVADVARAIVAQEGCFEFVPWAYCGGAFLRAPLAAGERERLGQGSIREPSDEDPEFVSRHLDFLQRRRLCILHTLESAGAQLTLQPCSGDPTVRLALARGRIVLFRHDWFGFSYTPMAASASNELALQAWLLEAPSVLRLESLVGEASELVATAFGGLKPAQAADRHVLIMSAVCKFPAKSNGLSHAWPAKCSSADGFMEMPITRWDVDIYYAADAEQFGVGKSSTKHAALLDYADMVGFDNKFFGLSEDEAMVMYPPTRLLMEQSFMCFYLAGHSRESLHGANVAIYVGDIGQEHSPFNGLAEGCGCIVNPGAWAKRTFLGGAVTACQVAMLLGTVGPVLNVDTACSSSLVTASMAHASLRKYDPNVDFTEALSMGLLGAFSPFAFIGLSGAGMLGRCGRCMTFNQTANGYNRGEGVGGISIRVTDDIDASESRLGNYVSSFINQDGRSASLTAPNGPSQQAVMRNSMRLEGILPEDVSMTENHGTGTALGDPIEVGSVRSVFRQHPTAIPVSAGKTNFGHLEASAGSVGFVRVIMQLLHSACAPNVHLSYLNAHIEVAGFPGLFPTELMDMPQEAGIAGLNGFGFGGTNCRSEVWAKCRRGPRAVQERTLQECRQSARPLELVGRTEAIQAADFVSDTCPRCLGPMCWRCGQARPEEAVSGGPHARHFCKAIRKEFSNYEYCSDCFAGQYQYGGAESSSWGRPEGRGVFLVGSWDGWTELQEMREVSEGIFVGDVRIGAAGFETFHFLVDEDRGQCIVPVGRKATADARIVGPLPLWRRGSWLLDGRADGAPEGALYEVRLEWAADRSKAVAWRRLNRTARAPAFRHTYLIVGSFGGWVPTELRPVSGDSSVWECQFSIGGSGSEDLYFMRDGDPDQMIYPLLAAPEDPGVPVIGPAPGDTCKVWRLRGAPGSLATARLRVTRGAGFEVQLNVEGGEAASWNSSMCTARDFYHAVGSFCEWSIDAAHELLPTDDPSAPGMYLSRFFIGSSGMEEFQIVVNQNWCQVLYPATPSAPGQGFLRGPEAAADTERDGIVRCWQVHGFPGLLVEVALDFGAVDQFRMVICRPVNPEVAYADGHVDVE